MNFSDSTKFLPTFPSLGQRQHFDTLEALKKVKTLILRCFGRFCFSHGSIVEHFKHERDNFVAMNDVSNYTNLLLTIPNLAER